MTSYFYVYIYFYLSGIPCYVGKGKDNRWLAHETKKRSASIHLKRLILQAKALGLDLPKIKIRENLLEIEAFEIERALIKCIGRRDLGTGPLVNLTDGGDGEVGKVMPESAKQKLRELNTGKRLSDEQKEKIGEGVRNAGYIPTAEHRKASSEKQIGKPKIWTPEGRARFIAAHTGKRWHLGHKHSEETRQKLREARARQTQRAREARLSAKG